MDALSESDHSTSSDEKYQSARSRRKTSLQMYMAEPTTDDCSLSAMLKFYCWPFDMRYEDLQDAGTPTFYKVIFRDSMAGLVSAMLAVPMAMGFAMASGLQPGQGIIPGAIAGLVGALFGGSKYQVYGPTAAFIPVINAIMAQNMEGGPFFVSGVDEEEIFRRGHGLLVLISLVAALMFMAMGMSRVGNLAFKVPYCIVVGFTIGIAVTIGFALSEEALGVEKAGIYLGFWPKLVHLYDHLGHVNGYAIVIAMATMILMQVASQISVLIPAGLLTIAFSTILAQTAWSGKHLRTVFDNYGHIPQTVSFTPPLVHHGNGSIIGKGSIMHLFGIIAYYVITIVVLGAVDSLLCARMADRLAGNRGTPFHPDKELWGMGWVNAIVPMLNGFPYTGSLAKTAVNVKLGAVTPLAAIVKCFLMLITVFTCATCLELIPMAAIAGLLWYVAGNMVSLTEIRRVRRHGGWAHIAVMCLTAVLVVALDFLRGVAFGMIIYALGFYAAPHLPEWITATSDGKGPKGRDATTDAAEEESAPLLKKSDGSSRGRSSGP